MNQTIAAATVGFPGWFGDKVSDIINEKGFSMLQVVHKTGELTTQATSLPHDTEPGSFPTGNSSLSTMTQMEAALNLQFFQCNCSGDIQHFSNQLSHLCN